MTLIRLTALTACAALLAACQPGGGADAPSLSLEGADLVPLETGVAVDPAQEALAPSCSNDGIDSAAMVEAVNAVRAAEGKVILKPESRLDKVAQSHACDVTRIGKPTVAGSNGSSIVDRARSVNYPTCGVIQLVAVGGSASEVISRWMGSPPHREQLLGDLSDDVGAGVTLGPDGRRWWSLVIGDSC
ncbi:CAP domain-containing protein [uncultured Paracoccus sp.]|uniref:CAP domain-containing protein n=1 Tax=uncultured Paracoccus sp. TaxID=189685 RepID=UPI00263121AC|nr:CAP domain-containing protein [uncultured Paracoccus sp.]